MEKSAVPMRSIYDFDNNLAAASAAEIDELSDRSQSLEQRIASLNDSYETLKKREVELTEWRWVLREAGGFFDRVHHSVLITTRTDNADEICRLEARPRRSAPRSKMKTMMPPSYKMSNNVARMVTLKVVRPLPS